MSRPKCAYVSGPMTGIEEYNYPLFRHVTEWLREVWPRVVSPHEIPKPPNDIVGDELWEYYMRECERQMQDCDAIVLLPGWASSKGSRQELRWAFAADMVVYYWDHTVTDMPVLMSRIEDEQRLDG